MALLTMRASAGRGWSAVCRRCGWVLAVLLLGSSSTIIAAETSLSAEYQVKAVFLFNFAQFVEWPATAFREPQSPLVIGVLGEDPFGAYLDELVSGEKVTEHPLQVRRYQRVEDIADCHILFIGRMAPGQLERIVAQLKKRSVLTVGDGETFTRQGGMVRFVTESGKIRLRINVEAAKACGLTISSKILRPATIVTAEKE